MKETATLWVVALPLLVLLGAVITEILFSKDDPFR
jgi:hypothetical protein